jgi:hypothetical protein
MALFCFLSQTIILIGVVFLTGGLRTLFAFAFAFAFV